MFKKLLFRNFKEDDLMPEIWREIDSIAEKVVLAKEGSNEYEDSISSCDGLLIKLGSAVDSNLMEKMPLLKYIGMLGTGYGNIDVERATKNNCIVCNIADYATTSVSEFVFGTLISHQRELFRAYNRALDKNYSEEGFTGSELRGKTLGIIGLGDIGLEVARIASSGFGMEVIYWSRHRKQSLETSEITYAELNKVLTGSDIISIHTALTKETSGLIGEKELSLTKDQCILVNTSPIEIIDFPALLDCLNTSSKHLIMDHADEMAPDDAALLVDSENCTVYPPIGYTSKEASTLKQKHFVKSMADFLNGKSFNQVN